MLGTLSEPRSSQMSHICDISKHKSSPTAYITQSIILLQVK